MAERDVQTVNIWGAGQKSQVEEADQRLALLRWLAKMAPHLGDADWEEKLPGFSRLAA